MPVVRIERVGPFQRKVQSHLGEETWCVEGSAGALSFCVLAPEEVFVDGAYRFDRDELEVISPKTKRPLAASFSDFIALEKTVDNRKLFRPNESALGVEHAAVEVGFNAGKSVL